MQYKSALSLIETEVAIKFIKDRFERELAKALEKTLSDTLGCDTKWVTVSIEDYNGKQWQEVFRVEVTENEKHLYKKPQYDPKILL